MRANIILSSAAVFIAAASGQTPGPSLDSVFRFTSPAAVQDLEEIRIGFRSLAMIREMSTGPGSESLTLRGTPEQIALAAWLFPQLDRSEPTSPVYRTPGRDDVARIFHLANIQTPQDLREISTSVRTMDAVAMLFALNTTKTIVMRGTASQVSFAEWLINAVDKPANGPTDLSTPQDYQFASGGNDRDCAQVWKTRRQEGRPRSAWLIS